MKKFRAKNNLHGKKRLVVQISHIHITHTSVRLLLSTTTIVIGGTLQKVGRSVDKTVFCVKSFNFFFVKPIYAIVECGLLIRIMYAWVRKIILNLLTIDIRIYNVRPNPSALTKTFFKNYFFSFGNSFVFSQNPPKLKMPCYMAKKNREKKSSQCTIPIFN